MIKIDDVHYVDSVKNINAVAPLYINSGTEVSPTRCQALIGGYWLIVNVGVDELLDIIEKNK